MDTIFDTPDALFDFVSVMNAAVAKLYGELPAPIAPERDEPFPGESDLEEE